MLALSTLYRSEHWLRSRNFVLGLFGAWIALFLLTSMQPLNTLMVPGLDLPLGFFMPLQAAVIVFATNWRSKAVQRGCPQGSSTPVRQLPSQHKGTRYHALRGHE